MIGSKATDELPMKSIRIRGKQHMELVRLQGFFQMKDGVSYSIADILDLLLDAFPEQEANLDDNMFSVEAGNGKKKRVEHGPESKDEN
jgi:hypothetical protein